METLRKKWNSSRGASILMALLFLLVCMMVGASILMAAVSNAGKLKSNREEQQKYLTLSSALTLICDELESVGYRGRYHYERIEHTEKVTNADGSESTWTYYEHKYKQLTGSVRSVSGSGGTGEWRLKDTFPLVNDLDSIFASTNDFKLPLSKRNPLDQYPDPQKLDVPNLKSPHTLELAVTDANYGDLSAPVVITAEVRASGGIVLTASLKKYPEYIMEAVLKSNEKPEQLLVLGSQTATGDYETKPLTWVVDYIVKKEKEAEDP